MLLSIYSEIDLSVIHDSEKTLPIVAVTASQCLLNSETSIN